MRIVIERSGSLVRASAEAPVGYRWLAGKVHELVAEARGGREASQDVRRDVRERIAFGMEPCPDLDCDWCHDRGIR